MLKTKLADSSKEIEALQKQVKSLKDILERFIPTTYYSITCMYAIVRSDREKSYLHKKLQSVQKNPPTRSKTPTTDNDVVHQTEQLKKKIHQLEEEVLHYYIINCDIYIYINCCR